MNPDLGGIDRLVETQFCLGMLEICEVISGELSKHIDLMQTPPCCFTQFSIGLSRAAAWWSQLTTMSV